MGDDVQGDTSEFPPDEGSIASTPSGWSGPFTANETQEVNEVVISLTQENDGLIQEVKELKSRLNAQIGGPVQMVDNKAAIEEVSLELN